MLLLVSVIVGFLVGLAIGGRPERLLDIRIRGWWLFPLAVAVQVFIFSGPYSSHPLMLQYGPYAYLFSLVLVLAALVLNLRTFGFAAVLLGALLNFLVVAANGGYMPTPPEAMARARGMERVESIRSGETLSNSEIAGDQTRLGFLGDILALPAGLPLSNVFSIGDAVLAGGAVLVIAGAMRTTKSQDTRFRRIVLS